MSECHTDQATVVGIQNSIAAQNDGKTLERPTIYAWLSHECQGFHNPTNPLNILGTSWTKGSSGILAPGNGFTYTQWPSLQAGYDATADYLLHSGHYGGIVSTMAPAGQGDAVKQAQAIQNSPWDGHYPGLDTTVQRITSLASQYPSWLSGSSSPGATSITNLPGNSATATATTADDIARFLGTDTTHVLTQADIDKIVNKLTASVPQFDPTGTEGKVILASLHTMFDPYVGKPVSAIPNDIGSGNNLGVDIRAALGGTTAVTGATTNPLDAAGAIANLPGAIAALLAPGATFMYVGCIIVGGILAFKGYTALAAGPNPVV